MANAAVPEIPALDIENLTKGIPLGSWVAIASTHDRVVAHGSTISAVVAEAESKGELNPLIIRVPEKAMAFL